MKEQPMTPREVNGILEMLDHSLAAKAVAIQAEHELRACGRHASADAAQTIVKRLMDEWQVARGMLERGGWVLWEGEETGVALAVPMIKSEKEAAKMQERLALGGAVGEGALPETSGGKSYQKTATGVKKPVTKGRNSRK
jgi:hypothetical protein